VAKNFMQACIEGGGVALAMALLCFALIYAIIEEREEPSAWMAISSPFWAVIGTYALTSFWPHAAPLGYLLPGIFAVAVVLFLFLIREKLFDDFCLDAKPKLAVSGMICLITPYVLMLTRQHNLALG
jgi:hypothetical protein